MAVQSWPDLAEAGDSIREFKELKVWQKAHRLVLAVNRDSLAFAADERFGLTAQLRHTARSLPSNIAEGCGRQTDRDLDRCLSIAAGSAHVIDCLRAPSAKLRPIELSAAIEGVSCGWRMPSLSLHTLVLFP
ncbi:MAG TPA: four helix bundle protein [Polyangiaceae bacterium]|nr:four helix bundle protein [Polyangiaceae bacterium]